MSDVAMSNQLLGPHLCHATPLFGLLTESSALCHQFRAKLMLLGDISLSEMLLKYFMSSI
jgi:hypothetical protein